MSEWQTGTYSRGSFSQNLVDIQPGVVSQPITFSLENPGDSVRGYMLSIQLYENKRWVSSPEWISLVPNVFTTIYPAGRQDVEENLRKGVATIQIQPPTNLDWAAGDHILQIMVSTHETTFTSGEAQQVDYYEFLLRMPAKYDIELRLEPEQQSGTMDDDYWLSLKNNSNTAVKLLFEASDRAEMLQFSFESSCLDLAEAAQGSVGVKLCAKAPLVAGESRSHHFSITVRLEEQPQTKWQVNGSWLQQPITVDLSLTPESVSVPIGEDAIYTVQVKNLSETALTVQLEAVDSKGLPFPDFKPAPKLLNPGQSSQETLQVHMNKEISTSKSDQGFFTVTAKAVEVPEIEVKVQGSWDRHAAVPPKAKEKSPWGWIIAGVIVVGIIIALIWPHPHPQDEAICNGSKILYIMDDNFNLIDIESRNVELLVTKEAILSELQFRMIKDLDQQSILLLKSAGVRTLDELANQNPTDLFERLSEINKISAFPSTLPSESQLANWVEQSKSLPRIIANIAFESPDWSPDCEQIVFTIDLGGNSDIYVMNYDGSGLRNITNSSSKDYSPQWSPDGTHIAFVSDRSGDYEIYSLDIKKGDPPINLSNSTSNEYWPSWSPDSKRIVFESDRTGNGDIYFANADGTDDPQRLDKIPVNHDSQPRWSPDGQKLVFISYTNPDPPKTDIYIFDIYGKNSQKLDRGDSPDWAPDSQRIVFQLNGQICILDTILKEPDCIVEGSWPAWQPVK